MRRLLVVIGFLVALWAADSMAAPHAEGCAFSNPPTTYETMQNRGLYMTGAELAGYNLIAPDDSFFGTAEIEVGTRQARGVAEVPYIPPTLLKAIGWIESSITQADWNTGFGAVGPALVSFDCGHGIMQVTSGMTRPVDESGPSAQQALVASHYLYNIARGAAILVAKWNAAPQFRPIAGTDTGGNPVIAENWYFAVWSYNGFTGPGARRSNHPLDPVYGAWPRTGYSCGPLGDGYGHHRGSYPYQELVFGCAARPPVVADQRLWPPLPLTLPDLSDPLWGGPLSLDNWNLCSVNRNCAAMDIPSPQPWHIDETPRPGAGTIAELRGSPALWVSDTTVDQVVNQVRLFNAGTGILAWQAKPQPSWISVDKQAGVALGPDVPCNPGAPCERSPVLTITVDAARAPPSGENGWVDIESLTTGQVWRVWVLRGDWLNRIGVPGTVSR